MPGQWSRAFECNMMNSQLLWRNSPARCLASVPGQGKLALQQAASLAMRDAAAKIAVEFREQAIVRGLIEPAAPLVEVPVQPPPP